ncbi:PaaX family transcriptional regulator C-terminal domain-containing protein [Brevibacillus sp. H7]|uniref:PaaX family transcriptional regulator n=1 Tax=Brevibacillus sp. H7 TaxID=3349138 RepID=UPI00382DB03F
MRSAFFTIFGDFIRKDDGMITMAELTRLLETLHFTEEAIKAAVFRMRHQKIVISKKKDGKMYYLLTEEGIEKMDEGLRRTFRESDVVEWDGWWRVLIYSVPEKKRQLRDQLRKEITWLGFGQVMPGTWISPYNLFEPVRRLIKQHKLESYVQMFESKHVGPGPYQTLVSQAWDLDGINQQYRGFIEEFEPRYQAYCAEHDKWDACKTFAERVMLVHEYRKFLHIDPQLPLELLPMNWLGEDARHLFRKMYQALTPGAMQFYKQVRNDRMAASGER